MYTRMLRMHPKDLGPPMSLGGKPMSLESGLLGPLGREDRATWSRQTLRRAPSVPVRKRSLHHSLRVTNTMGSPFQSYTIHTGRGKGAKGSSSPSCMVSVGETIPPSSATGTGHRGAGSSHALRPNPNPTSRGLGQGPALQPQAGRQSRTSTTHTTSRVNDNGAGVIPMVLPTVTAREPQGTWSPQHASNASSSAPSVFPGWEPYVDPPDAHTESSGQIDTESNGMFDNELNVDAQSTTASSLSTHTDPSSASPPNADRM